MRGLAPRPKTEISRYQVTGTKSRGVGGGEGSTEAWNAALSTWKPLRRLVETVSSD